MTAPRAVLQALLAAAGAAAVVACGTSPATSLPATSPPATVAPASPAPTPSQGSEPAALVVGCISINEAECQLLARRIVAGLPAERGRAFAVEIQLFMCELENAPCPPTLDARTGKAVVEFLDQGEPIDLFLEGPALTPSITPQDGFYLGLTEPSSPRVNGAGPFPFDVGHCGITHVIDFDGSFWVPIGQVEGDHPTILNAESGVIRLLGPSLAEFRGQSGFAVQLARFPGPKHFWGCD